MTGPAIEPPDSFHAACETVGLSLGGDEVDQLGRYLHLLLETNRQFNLTAIRDPEAAWHRHVLDSLSLLPFLPPHGEPDGGGTSDEAAAATDAVSIVDLGTGAGLPGMVLAIVRPDAQVTLLEATGKKARFCERVAGDLALGNVRVIAERAETAGRQARHRQRYDVVTARAVGPMRVMLEFTLPLAKVGGRLLAMKGRRVTEELDEAGDALMALGGGAVELYEALPGLADDAVIVEVAKAEPTPKQYPRRPGEPKVNPL